MRAKVMTERYAAARKHLRDADPVLARLIDKNPNFDPRAWMAVLPKMGAYGALVFQIVGQQLSVRSTRAILARLEALFDGRLPEPQEILDADAEELRRAGISRRKVQTLRTVAERFTTGELSDQTLLQSSDEEIEAALTAIPGIGPWTVHGFLIIALDRPDVVLAGDLALRRAIRNVYGLDHMPTEPEVLEIAERWRPYRSLAVTYLFASEFKT
jgi:DNA-3-methyladenine glycosylase II